MILKVGTFLFLSLVFIGQLWLYGWLALTVGLREQVSWVLGSFWSVMLGILLYLRHRQAQGRTVVLK